MTGRAMPPLSGRPPSSERSGGPCRDGLAAVGVRAVDWLQGLGAFDERRVLIAADAKGFDTVVDVLEMPFEQVEALGPPQARLYLCEEAVAQGWATAMSGEFTAQVRRNGRDERSRASSSDVQVIHFVEPPDRSAIDEWTA